MLKMKVKLKTLFKKLREMGSQQNAYDKKDFDHLKRFVNQNYKELFMSEHKVVGDYLLVVLKIKELKAKEKELKEKTKQIKKQLETMVEYSVPKAKKTKTKKMVDIL